MLVLYSKYTVDSRVELAGSCVEQADSRVEQARSCVEQGDSCVEQADSCVEHRLIPVSNRPTSVRIRLGTNK